MPTESLGRSVGDHYGRGDLLAAILEALRDAGKDPGALTMEDLAPIDQLHARGKRATLLRPSDATRALLREIQVSKSWRGSTRPNSPHDGASNGS